MTQIAVFYYSRSELIQNSSVYYPSTKNSIDPFDISYLNQVKANLYNESSENVGVFHALNNFRSTSNDGVNTGIVTIRTNDGIVSWINAYDVGSSNQPFLNNDILFTKCTFVSGLYSENGIDVYIKVQNIDKSNSIRKIEVFY